MIRFQLKADTLNRDKVSCVSEVPMAIQVDKA